MTDEATIADVAWELRDRVERENREWHEARMHYSLHHTWLAPDECATCIYEAEKTEA